MSEGMLLLIAVVLYLLACAYFNDEIQDETSQPQSPNVSTLPMKSLSMESPAWHTDSNDPSEPR